MRAPHLVVAVPRERHDLHARDLAAVRQVGEPALHGAVPALGREPAPLDQPLQPRLGPGDAHDQPGLDLRVPLGVHLGAAGVLPAQERRPDAAAAPVGVHPAVEVDPVGVAEGGAGGDDRVGDERAVGVGDGDPVTGRVDPPAGPLLGDVVGVGELPGVVERLRRDQQLGDRRGVAGAERADGQAVGHGGQGGHGSRG
nr:hypothetical protein [Blastococcus sp. KM273129]